MRRCFYQIGPMQTLALPFGENGMGKGKREMPWGWCGRSPRNSGESRPHAFHALENERAAPLVFSIKRTRARP